MIELRQPLSNDTPFLQGLMEFVGQSSARGWVGRRGRRGGCRRFRGRCRRNPEDKARRCPFRNEPNSCRPRQPEQPRPCLNQNVATVPAKQAANKPVQEMKKRKAREESRVA